jgi:hypothetical protein
MSEKQKSHELASQSDTFRHLKELERSGDYVFHGTSEPLSRLDPRQAYSHGKPDGTPAVCAASDVDTAIFMALQRCAVLALQERGQLGQRSSAGYSNHGENYHFYGSPEIVQELLSAHGYVHVLPKDGFTSYYGDREVRSAEPVTPVETIEVTFMDFPHFVHPRTPEDTITIIARQPEA